jgi:hypothetical protein
MKIYQFETYKEGARIYGSVARYKAVLQKTEEVRSEFNETWNTITETYKVQTYDLSNLSYIWPRDGDK